MKRLLAILLTIFICATAMAQIENSIVLDRSTFRAVQTDALTGVNVDPIGVDSSRRQCARLKIFFHRMTREQMAQLEPVFPSGIIDYTKCKVAEGNTVLILEFTARPQVKFYLKHPTFGTSNEVTFDYEGNKEYQMEASLNQTFSIVVESNVVGAEVYIDGVFKGQTGDNRKCTVSDVMIGGHTLKLIYGSVSHEQGIEVNKSSIDFRQNVGTEIVKKEILVVSNVAGADVYLDGEYKGKTDADNTIFINEVEIGRHKLKLTYDNVPKEQDIEVKNGSKKFTLKVDTDTADKQRVIFRVLPVDIDAEVQVAGVSMPVGSNGIGSLSLNSGTYQFTVTALKYHSYKGSFEVRDRQVNMPEITLKPTFGTLVVSGSSLDDAVVYIDDTLVNRETLNNIQLAGGDHLLRIKRDRYKTYELKVHINEGQESHITPELEPMFTEVTIQAPSSDVEIWLNNKFVATGNYTVQLDFGKYEVEARKASHTSIFQSFEVDSAQPLTIELNAPVPICGTLSVISTPQDAVVYLDNEIIDQKNLITLPIGEHKITVSKPGYQPYTATVTVTEGKTTTVNATLAVTIAESKTATKDFDFGRWVIVLVLLILLVKMLVYIHNKINVYKVKRYRKLAEQGDVVAQYNLGHCYEQGCGVTKDSTEAKKWYLKAAEQGMVFVKGGTFTMGAINGLSDEKPRHSVTLSDYYIGKYEVTQAYWRAVMGSNPSHFRGDNLPVECVSWYDIQVFIQKLNKMTGKKFRLPTEAEWEYAARGGNESKGYKYSGSNNISDVAWYYDNSSSKTHPVGQKQPNELGVYDMTGNVWEWCSDWYGSYNTNPQINPKGPSSGTSRVLRGGGWYRYSSYCRVSYRDSGSPGTRYSYNGFRLACSAELNTATSTPVEEKSALFARHSPVTSTTKPYKIGDYYNENGKEGVVFEVTADGCHGKIVCMKQARMQWSSDSAEQKRLIGANSETDGAANMAKVKAISGWRDKYPAFAWCADLGEGWYLPSIDELKTFTLNDAVYDAVNRALLVGGGTKLYGRGKSGCYWSSTEHNSLYQGYFCAWYILMSDGSTLGHSKYYYYYVRAVYAF